VECPEYPSQFRPIALANVITKIITKAIVLRTSLVSSSILHKVHSSPTVVVLKISF
jgi:hypothetical protein